MVASLINVSSHVYYNMLMAYYILFYHNFTQFLACPHHFRLCVESLQQMVLLLSVLACYVANAAVIRGSAINAVIIRVCQQYE